MAQSLELSLSKKQVEAASRAANAAAVGGWLPELKAGVSAERAEEWGIGPAVELELPLLYQGQGEAGVARARARQARHTYAEVAVAVRAIARRTARELESRRKLLSYYESALLPLKQRVVQEGLLQYNAMQIGLFELLQAQRECVQTQANHVQQLHDYWVARTNAEQLLAGRRPPDLAAARSITAGARDASVSEAGH